AGKEKKRKRTEGEVCLSPVTPSEKEGSIDLDVKRLRLPTLTPSATHSPRSRLGGKRSLPGGRGTSSSPLASLFTPRRLSEKGILKPRLSPRPGPPDQGKGDEWSCGACTYSNSILLPYCEVCESPLHRPSTGECTHTHTHVGRRNIHQSLCLSLHQEDSPLHWNFIPLDIKLDSWEDLPEAFRRRENRTQVSLFDLQVDITVVTRGKLYLTKEDVTQASLSKAKCDGGTVRMVNKENFFTKRRTTSMSRPNTSASGPSEAEAGYLQVVDSEGRPLCLSCHKACGSTGGAWDTCFCSQKCQEEFQLRSSQAYMRARVLQTEQGVCQSCGLQAHQLYLKVRDAPPTHRKEMLENTWLAQLSLKQLNEMIRAPVEGQFWQVDHIRPVYSGGGQCSLDNLQTLCTVCHRTRTAQQAKDRSQMKKGLAASKVASDITRFFIKK
uniref:RanBP2-type domain-containing protein n=1 Tax=Hucho hucho TaxID=62062 RepID=A0A4W5MFJ7_9TELE